MKESIIAQAVKALLDQGPEARKQVESNARREIAQKVIDLIFSYNSDDLGYVIGCIEATLDKLRAGLTDEERKTADYIRQTTMIDATLIRVFVDGDGNIVLPKGDDNDD